MGSQGRRGMGGVRSSQDHFYVDFFAWFAGLGSGGAAGAAGRTNVPP